MLEFVFFKVSLLIGMNCIIVDDDDFVRKVLTDFVEKTESLALLFSLSNAMDAMDVLRGNESIDLIFLDVEMPGMSGIDFLNTLNNLPQIIIVSFKGEYAVDAFEYDVTDFLLKPFTYDRFCKAVERALKRQEAGRMFSKEEEIFIKYRSTLVKLRYSEILWVEAMENYVLIHTFQEKYTIHFTMKAIAHKLPSRQFIRVHRSFIVNLTYIAGIFDHFIQMKANETIKNEIPVGKSYKCNLLPYIDQFNK